MFLCVNYIYIYIYIYTHTHKGHKEIVEALLQRVSHNKLSDFINAKTIVKGTTSLHVATENSFLEAVKSLLKHGAIYNIKNKEGKTPLDLSRDQNMAVFRKYEKVVAKILSIPRYQQSIMIFALLSLLAAIIMNTFYRQLGFTVCYNKWFEIRLCAPKWMFGGFCIIDKQYFGWTPGQIFVP